MRINKKHLQKNFLNKESKFGQSVDLAICIIQSCEVAEGEYCLLTNTRQETELIVDYIREFVESVSNLKINIIHKNLDFIVFDNGSVIYFKYKKGNRYLNLFFDSNRNTTIENLEHFYEMESDFVSHIH